MELIAKERQEEPDEIPSDWQVSPLSEICSKIQDGTHFSPKIKGGSYLYVTSKNIGFGVLNVDNAPFIDEAQHRAIYKRCDVKRGDILLTKDGANTGNAALNTLDEEISLLSSVAFLRFDVKLHSSEYFLQQILSDDGQKQIKDAMSGNAITRLTLQKINKLTFYYPPEPEQRAIATVLSDANALLDSLDRLIAKKRAIKQAVMQQLVSGKTRLPGFDGEWMRRDIGEIFFISAGGDLRKDQYSPIQTQIHIHPIFSNSICNKGVYGYCSTLDYEGDHVTITARGGIGHAVFREGGFCAIGRLLVLQPKEACSCKFFEEYINQYLVFANESTGVPQLTAPQVAKYEVLVPEYEEQIAIAEVLSDMDTEIEALEKRSAKTRDIKQAMMQKLLTGRIRLV